ncbi:MAG TPA: response regulator [Polyangia bacterium]|nr:response regulator [Polyangia bacterium]
MGKRILIADDSVTIQKAFAMTLVGEDFALTSARSADEGLTLARQTRPDVVIADASMPGRSGYELCAALKADASLRAIPVYILSSTHQPYDEAKGQQVGADGNLIKPWDSGALIEKIKEAAAGGRPAAAAARPAAAPSAPAPRPTSTLPSAALGDYDVDMDAPRDTAPTATRSTATSMPAFSASSPSLPAARPSAPAAAPAGGMRPSLIPGIRPGAMPPVRPGTSPSRTLGNTTPLQAAVPPRPAAAASQPVGRTLFGLPAASMPFPGSTRPAQPVSAPGITHAPVSAHAPAPTSAPAPHVEPLRPATSPAMSPAMSPAILGLVDQKVAAIAAKGPEYEALAKLSREVIEQIVWEIVPELAEAIIREQVAKRGVV